MGKRKPVPPHTEKGPSEISLKGTFIAVMGLGVFILLAWFASYWLFLSR